MATVCSQDLVTPFLMKMLGQMQVLSTNLKCEKQNDGNYLYEYSVEVHPKEEDEELAALLRSESLSTMGYGSSSDYTTSINYTDFSMDNKDTSKSTHSELDCICMFEVRFVLYHQNMNGKGVFAPRLSYCIGRDRSTAYPLMDTDLDKTLAELCGSDLDSNTITIIADVTR